MANSEGRYVKTTLSKKEKILEVINEHWMEKLNYWLLYFAGLAFLLMGGAVFSWGVQYVQYKDALVLFSLAIGIIFVVMAVYRQIEFYFREIVLTNKRFVYKRGIIGVKTEEQILAKTDTVEMDQSVLGRIFGYAAIKLTTTGGSVLRVEYIDDARKAKSRIEEAL
ncbi:MAG: PH domain-containing protein [Candidatus Portiera sp.]|nr:PH domain-containing protein [Portiera sp.]